MPEPQSIQIEHAGETYELSAEMAADIKRHYQRVLQTPQAARHGIGASQHWMLLKLIQSAGIPIELTDDAVKIGRRVAQLV